jgi:hypothetical protein
VAEARAELLVRRVAGYNHSHVLGPGRLALRPESGQP